MAKSVYLRKNIIAYGLVALFMYSGLALPVISIEDTGRPTKALVIKSAEEAQQNAPIPFSERESEEEEKDSKRDLAISSLFAITSIVAFLTAGALNHIKLLDSNPFIPESISIYLSCRSIRI